MGCEAAPVCLDCCLQRSRAEAEQALQTAPSLAATARVEPISRRRPTRRAALKVSPGVCSTNSMTSSKSPSRPAWPRRVPWGRDWRHRRQHRIGCGTGVEGTPSSSTRPRPRLGSLMAAPVARGRCRPPPASDDRARLLPTLAGGGLPEGSRSDGSDPRIGVHNCSRVRASGSRQFGYSCCVPSRSGWRGWR